MYLRVENKGKIIHKFSNSYSVLHQASEGETGERDKVEEREEKRMVVRERYKRQWKEESRTAQGAP